jgi:hypothetical protein
MFKKFLSGKEKHNVVPLLVLPCFDELESKDAVLDEDS